GTAIGELPKGVSRTSIQEDFDRQMSRLKLEKFKKTVAEDLTLDLRENRHVKSADAAFLDLNRSTFFHRLRVLGVGFAKPLPSGQQAATWAERWKMQWSPESEIALVEAVLLGETVELAAACDNQAAKELVVSIGELNRVSLEHHERVEGELWVDRLRKLADADDRNPLLSGYACAVLLERGLIANEDLAREVSRRLSPGI